MIDRKDKKPVRLSKVDIFPFASKGEYLYMVIGSDNPNAEKAFANSVENSIDVNVRGLFIKGVDSILTGFDFKESNKDIINSLNRKLETLKSATAFHMPADYDFNTQTAYKEQGYPLKYSEPSGVTYLKYGVSLLGNPNNYILFRIKKSDYKTSDFYINTIKPKTHNGR